MSKASKGGEEGELEGEQEGELEQEVCALGNYKIQVRATFFCLLEIITSKLV